MSLTRTPREVGEAWFGPMWNNRDMNLMRDLMAPDAVGHLEGGVDVIGPEGFESFMQDFLSAVPDLKLEVKNLLSDADDVCVHWRATGRHTGTGLGLLPSDAAVNFQGVTWLRVKDGRLTEGWDFWNRDGLIRTLSGAAVA